VETDNTALHWQELKYIFTFLKHSMYSWDWRQRRSNKLWTFLGQKQAFSFQSIQHPHILNVIEVDCFAWFQCKLPSLWSGTSLNGTVSWCQYSVL